jgi:hypothetical protein
MRGVKRMNDAWITPFFPPPGITTVREYDDSIAEFHHWIASDESPGSSD